MKTRHITNSNDTYYKGTYWIGSLLFMFPVDYLSFCHSRVPQWPEWRPYYSWSNLSPSDPRDIVVGPESATVGSPLVVGTDLIPAKRPRPQQYHHPYRHPAPRPEKKKRRRRLPQVTPARKQTAETAADDDDNNKDADENTAVENPPFSI